MSDAPPLDESVEFRGGTAAEKKVQREMEELYSIMQACEHLETAFIKGATPPGEYTPQCLQLFSVFDEQVKVLTSLKALGRGSPDDVRAFMRAYAIVLPSAEKRLLVERAPATTFNAGAGPAGAGGRMDHLVVDITSAIITAMDAAHTVSAIDELLPHVSFACERLARYTRAPPDWPARKKITGWLVRLQGMAAADELSPADRRQLRMDFESTFEAFKNLTQDAK